jgi:response regulator RpfG family c-di-GMP phosphodiesterase
MLKTRRRNSGILVTGDHSAHNHVGCADIKAIAESSDTISAFEDPENTKSEFFRGLACTAERGDGDNGRHPHRVGEFAALIGRSLGLPQHRVEKFRIAASLHDIGKIGISDRILLKPEKLTIDEYETIKTHTTIGSAILTGSRFPCLVLAQKIALYHHERWDGNGHWGLQSGAIPIEAQSFPLQIHSKCSLINAPTSRHGLFPMLWRKSIHRVDGSLILIRWMCSHGLSIRTG